MFTKIKNWFIWFLDLDRDNAVTAEDLELAKALAEKKVRDANETINSAVKETKRRAKRVKEEVKDVVDALEEVVNQAEDVVDAANGKARRGRKKKTDD